MYSSEVVCKTLDYINNNINNIITIDDLSEHLYFDKTYIMKQFKKELNITIVQYINILRVLNSLDYYIYDNTILSIALKNGFNSIEYYSEVFRSIIGVNPNKYRRFVMRKKNSSISDERIILKRINSLLVLRNRINKYLANRKPKEAPVKLLVFK